MSQPFDPYYRWLGIPPDEQPPDYYRLLGMRRGENDPEVISNAADRQMLHVRSFQTGPRAAECQRLLNELAAARACLLDPVKKAAYDMALGSAAPSSPRAPQSANFARSATAPQPVPAPQISPSPSVGPPAFASATAPPVSPRSRRGQRSAPKPLVLPIVQVVGGGAAGIAVALLILWYGFGVDPLGVMADWAPGGGGVAAIPANNADSSGGEQSNSRGNSRPSAADQANDAKVGGRPNAAASSASGGGSSTSSDRSPSSASDDEKDLPSAEVGSSSSGPSSPRDSSLLRPLETPEAAPQKHPIPTEHQKRAARQRLKEAVGEDLAAASSPEEQRNRLARLRQLADQVQDEPNVLYVVLEEAYDQAGELRLFDDAGKIVDRVVEGFDVDEVAVRSKMLKDFAQIARLPQDRMLLATSALALAETAHEQEKYQPAAELADLAEGQSAKAGNAEARVLARERSAEFKRAARNQETYNKALARLDAEPEHPGANTLVGRYLTVFRGNFAQGVPHLAKGEDGSLKEVAQRDLAAPTDVEEQAKLADAWFDAAAADPELAPLYARARYWYRRAEPAASGLVAVKIRSRLDLIDQFEKAGTFRDRTGSASSGESNRSLPTRQTKNQSRAAPGGSPPAPFLPPPGGSAPPSLFGPGVPPVAGGIPPEAYARVNQLAPTSWRAVLRQRDSRQPLQHPSISIQNDNGVVTVSKEASPEVPSIHLINEIPLPPDFTVRMSVTFHRTGGASGGTPIPYLGFRSLDGKEESYIHASSLASAQVGARSIVIARRAGAIDVTIDGRKQTVNNPNNAAHGNIFIHLNDEARVTIHSFTIDK